MAKILLVEDDNNLREIYGARLTAEGYEIIAAPDGEEALAIAVKEKPDLIITDVMMPKISGFDMLDILRNAPETKDTKVIMMTALSQAEDKERADKLGADLYLVKSQVTLEDVAASVRKILESGNNNNTTEEKPAEAAPAQPPSPNPEPPTPTPAPVPEPAPVPAPTPPSPDSQTSPAGEGTKEAAPPATPAPTPSTPAVPSVPAPDPVPAPSPAPTPTPVPPAEPPTPTPAPAPEPEPPKPVAKKIEVVLPDSKEEPVKAPKPVEEEKPSEAAPAPSGPSVSPPAAAIDDGGLSIGPNLAEALAEEEKTLPEQQNDTKEEKPSEAAPAPSGPSTVVKPQVSSTTALDGPSADKHTPGPTPAAPITGTSAKKVIEPINDPTKTPDLNTLLAEEEAREQGLPSINPPATPATGDSANQPEHPDDFSKISL